MIYPINYKSKLGKYSEESTWAGALREGETVKGGTTIEVDAQGVGRNGQTIVADMCRSLGQVLVPAELRDDVSDHEFWKWGTTLMFDIIIVNLNAGSYLHMTPKKALEKENKDKKGLYLQACLERRCSFTLMLYSADEITGVEALVEHKIIVLLLSFKMKREYSELCGVCKGQYVTKNSEVQQPAPFAELGTKRREYASDQS